MLFIRKILKNKVIRYAYVGWLIFALFYFYQYILRVAPGVLIDEIRYSYRITAEQFASLGALYLLAYSLLQIPLGIIVDRIGVKKMCLYSVTILTFGAVLMSITEEFWIAQLSRFIIGAGSASAFMCAMKFIADHIPPGNRGFLMGATLAFGTAGAVFSARIVRYLDEFFNWRDVVMMSAGMGVVIFVLIALAVRGTKRDHNIVINDKTLRENMLNVLNIFCSSKIIIYAILAIGLYAPLSALADLWGTAFLKQKYGISKIEAAQLGMVLYVGLTVGSLVLPWFSEKYKLLNRSIILCSAALLISFSMLVYMPEFNLEQLVVLLFIIGFFCGAEMMCFTGALEESNKYDSGQIIGVVNTLNMFGGAIIQQLVGYLLDKHWDGVVDEFGIRQYSTEQFQSSLTVLTVLIALCFICSLALFFVKFKRRTTIAMI
jgi:MFS family permease